MEPSKQSEEILNLGRKLAKRLGAEHSHDVLGHWLSYYLAELMTRAEAAEGDEKRALEQECLDIILKIWKNRASAPRGIRPLGDLEPAIRLLKAIGNAGDRSWEAFIFRGKDPWHKAGATIQETAQLIMGLLLYRQTLDTNWPEVTVWKDELPSLLAEEEVELIEGIQAMTARVGYYYGLDKLGRDPAGISKVVIEKLRQELQRQSDAVDELEKAIASKEAGPADNPNSADDGLEFSEDDNE